MNPTEIEIECSQFLIFKKQSTAVRAVQGGLWDAGHAPSCAPVCSPWGPERGPVFPPTTGGSKVGEDFPK